MYKRGDLVVVFRYPENGQLPARDEIAKIMAVADGYAMLRKKGCAPFIRHLKDLDHLNDGETK